MAKTVGTGTLEKSSLPFSFGGSALELNVLPDPFDERDLAYRPRLQPLPPSMRNRPELHVVMTQQGNSCVGHALAAMVNTVLAPAAVTAGTPPPRVSPYMFYYLARRYDEFAGEEDIGSSLRGGLKGWFNHGICSETGWKHLSDDGELLLTTPTILTECRNNPLGAYYRVNPYRLDDMQSAICELQSIVASAAVHTGWLLPRIIQRNGRELHVIARGPADRPAGGHAFALVGYNEVGFMVHNSWGPSWGDKGFATLSYEDWLDTAYDAWVARPGVPQTPFATGRSRVTVGTGSTLSTGPGPDLVRLRGHVVNLGNDGRLSTRGSFVSTPEQIEAVFDAMDARHQQWATMGITKRLIVLYAHGGLNSEKNGLAIADKHLDWWLRNHVYPINFAWQTGPMETLVDQLSDSVRKLMPFGGIQFDLKEQFDRLVELTAKRTFRWMWDEMKENARAASKKSRVIDPGTWDLSDRANHKRLSGGPGGTIVAARLKKYIETHGAENVVVHLVGHSAGSIFHAALLGRLKEYGIRVESLSYLAPAIRVDEFEEDVLSVLGATVSRFCMFILSDQRELDDGLPSPEKAAYHKSLLYLVSRGLERSRKGKAFEIPILGMERFLSHTVSPGISLREAIESAGGDIVIAPSGQPADARSNARTHGDFDDDAQTMTSVMMRMLGVSQLNPAYDYGDAGGTPAANAPSLETRAASPTPSVMSLLHDAGWVQSKSTGGEKKTSRSPKKREKSAN